MVPSVSYATQIEAPDHQSMSSESPTFKSLSHCKKAACGIGSTLFCGGIGMCIVPCVASGVAGTPLAMGLFFGGCGVSTVGFLTFGMAIDKLGGSGHQTNNNSGD